MEIIFVLLIGIILFFTILFAIKNATDKVIHYPKRGIIIDLNL